MDRRTHRAADPVSNLNLQMGVEPDQGAVLRVRNPSDTRELLIESPSTGFKNINVVFATARTGNGAQSQEFYYSTDAGDNWVLVHDYHIVEIPDWRVQRLDLSAFDEVDNNPKLMFKILFTGDSAANDSGNNRFDNFTMFGVVQVPELTLLEDHLDFGNCRVNATIKQSFSIENESDFVAHITITPPEDFSIALSEDENAERSTGIEYSLEALSTTSFDIYFTPKKEGSYDTQLKILYHALEDELILALNGLGTQPEVNKLLGAYPNPYADNTNIIYDINKEGKVELGIYNIKGQLVRKQSFTHDGKGRYSWRFDARDQHSRILGSGVYIVRMKFGKYIATKKMTLIK